MTWRAVSDLAGYNLTDKPRIWLFEAGGMMGMAVLNDGAWIWSAWTCDSVIDRGVAGSLEQAQAAVERFRLSAAA